MGFQQSFLLVQARARCAFREEESCAPLPSAKHIVESHLQFDTPCLKIKTFVLLEENDYARTVRYVDLFV
jgi:hypothetical protein